MTRDGAARRAAIALAAVGFLAFAAGACSSDDDAAGPTTATTSTTLSRRPPGTPPSAAELTALLPTDADLGEGWVQFPTREAGSGDDLPVVDPAAVAQCPPLGILLGAETEASADSEGEGADPVIRAFGDEAGRGIGVKLDPDAPMRSDAELEEAIDATNACGAIVVEEVAVSDSERATATIRFQASLDPDHGEQAVKLQAEVATLLPGEDDAALATLYLLVFRTGSVVATVWALDGLDLESLAVTRTDVEQLASLSDRLEAAVDDLGG